MTIQLAIFGYGFIATAHAEGLAQLPNGRLRTVCGPNLAKASAFAQRFNIPNVTTDPQMVLTDPQIAAVIIDTPDEAHAPLAILAAQHGKHIFCEKPLATSLATAQAMVEAAEQAHVRTLVGFSNRWNPTFQHVHQLINAGSLGRIHHVHAQSFNASLLSNYPAFTWRTDPQRTGSGVLGDLGAHAIDLIHYLLGPITAVCASLRTQQPILYDRETGLQHTAAVDDEALLLIRLGNDIEGTIALSRLGAEYSDFPIGHRQFLIGGSHGAVTYENGYARLYHPNHQWEELPSDRPPAGQDHATFLAQGTARILHTFLQAIEQQADLPPTFRDGLRCQAVLDAAIRSSHTHAWENILQVHKSR